MTTERLPRATWDAGWHPDQASVEALAALTPGAVVTVVKRAPDGSEAARYDATVATTAAPSPWVELVAEWTLPRVDVSGLVFETGDTLREFFSAEHPYNAFAVIGPDDTVRGWYGNVTYPAFMEAASGEDILVWHDLYLDVVILPDGTRHLLDDDELEESSIPSTDPGFAAAIIQARRELIDLILRLAPGKPGLPPSPAPTCPTAGS